MYKFESPIECRILKHTMPILPDVLLINVMTYAGDDLRCYMLAITVWITLENLFPLLDSLKVVLSSGDLKNIGDVTKLSFVRNLSIRCRQGVSQTYRRCGI